MHNPRSNFGIEIVGNEIVAMGGFNGYSTTYNVESYDAVNDEWYELPDMNVFRSALACVTIKSISMEALKRYSSPRISELDNGQAVNYQKSQSRIDLNLQLKYATDRMNEFLARNQTQLNVI